MHPAALPSDHEPSAAPTRAQGLPAEAIIGDDGLTDPVLEDLAEQRIAERGER